VTSYVSTSSEQPHESESSTTILEVILYGALDSASSKSDQRHHHTNPIDNCPWMSLTTASPRHFEQYRASGDIPVQPQYKSHP
jgi:hypothetical protein